MNNRELQQILEVAGDSLQGQAGAWQLMVQGRLMLVLTDESHNRMRIISPIVEVSELEAEHLQNALIANFHTALDVKYAIAEGIMWAVFIHPLRQLSHEQVKDAIAQVYQASETFGSTYSSTDLYFPGGEAKEPPAEEEQNPPDKKKKSSKT
ncbi:MAG: hypothetical protein D6730_19915 [Bacteroidetes bacterium]|nr:MAG: hypothetical protein D6730_19915 [Bacteroidota bacterium]